MAKSKKILSNYRRLRSLLRKEHNKGVDVGEFKAKESYKKREKILEDNTLKQVQSEIKYYTSKINKIRVEHYEDLKKFNTICDNKINDLRKEHKKELNKYIKEYDDKCIRNNELTKKTINESEGMRQNAIDAEQYWRERNDKQHDFMQKLIGVGRLMSDRYEYLQNTITKVQVSKDMVNDLQDEYNTMLKLANKNAPKVVTNSNQNSKKS